MPTPPPPNILAEELEETRCPQCAETTVRIVYAPLGHICPECGHLMGPRPSDSDHRAERQCEDCGFRHCEPLFRWDAECSCGWEGRPPELVGHSMDCQRWAEFLMAIWPDAFAEPEQSAFPTDVLPGRKKVAVMADRVARGLSPWHPADARPEQADEVGKVADPGRNGRIYRQNEWLLVQRYEHQRKGRAA